VFCIAAVNLLIFAVFAMPASCPICNNVVSRHDTGVLCDGNCRRVFHPSCVGAPQELLALSGKTGISWRCNNCAGTIAAATSSDSVSSSLLALKNEISLMKEEQRGLRSSVDFVSDKFDEFHATIASLNSALATITSLEGKVSSLELENDRLRAELCELQQYSRVNNVEISNVPESKSENVIEIVTKIGQVVGCNISSSDIDACHRVPHIKSDNKQPRSIVVKFISRQRKSELLAASRRYRNLSSKELQIAGQGSTIYVNEHLTYRNKMLHRDARDFCRKYQYKFVWVRDCKIFIKKSDSSKAILVRDNGVLSRLSSCAAVDVGNDVNVPSSQN